MKFIHYEEGTGKIKIITSARLGINSTFPFIEVDDSVVEGLITGQYNVLDYTVKGSTKHLVRSDKIERSWNSINDWLYLIPKHTEFPEFTITQFTSTQFITIRIDDETATWWKDNKYFGRSEVPLFASHGVDPHRTVWVKTFKPEELIDGIEFNYTGTNDLRFYTHRYFERYLHEQHT